MDKELGKRITYALRQMHGKIDLNEFIARRIRSKELFEYIIAVMLSQNTSDRNAIKAYERLRDLLNGSIVPEKILQTRFDDIVNAIRPAGMHYQRARRIIELAKLFMNNDFVNKIINDITNMDVEEARKLLTSLPGIGSKSADVILLMYFGKPTFPVDTHIMRITKRLGYIGKYDYENIRRFWMDIIDPRDYLEIHLLLVTHGRRICKPRNPLCNKCLLSGLCKFNLSKNIL
ncbi:MAG: endonuclease III [Thermoprotei archaeon]|nr:MAG: endonuclease III [Thermoprotei archaeon]